MDTHSTSPAQSALPRCHVTTSWDDGHRLDPKLAALLEKYAIPGTFYIAPRNLEIEPGDRLDHAGIRELSTRFEIGGHTLTHQRLPRISATEAQQEIRDGKAELEDIINAPVTSFCYPRGEYTPAHARMAKEAGFSLARTVKRGSLRPGSPFDMLTTVNAYAHRVDVAVAVRLAGSRPWTAPRLFLEWDELAIHWFERALEQGGLFHLWGHSWEVDLRRDWSRLERVLAHICGRGDVAYIENRAIPALAL